MPYIYKYTDQSDDVVKYVGIIRKDSNFPNRFKQHLFDTWCKGKSWKIEFAYFKSVSDVEMLEGHFITYYETGRWYNKSKCNWGLSSFQISVDWEVYDPYSSKTGIQYEDICKNFLHEIVELSTKLEELDKKFSLLDRARDEDIKKSQCDWINNRLYFIPFHLQYRTSKEEAYIDYRDYCHNNDLYCVEDMDEWFRILSIRYRLQGCISTNGGFIEGVVLISSDDFPVIEQWTMNKEKELVDKWEHLFKKNEGKESD